MKIRNKYKKISANIQVFFLTKCKTTCIPNARTMFFKFEIILKNAFLVFYVRKGKKLISNSISKSVFCLDLDSFLMETAVKC